jgi:hypothetical protein
MSNGLDSTKVFVRQVSRLPEIGLFLVHRENFGLLQNRDRIPREALYSVCRLQLLLGIGIRASTVPTMYQLVEAQNFSAAPPSYFSSSKSYPSFLLPRMPGPRREKAAGGVKKGKIRKVGLASVPS